MLFSIDEMLELHERLDVIGVELRKYLPFHIEFVWVIPGAIIAAIFVVLLLRMVLSLPSGVRTGLIVSGMIFVGGGFGAETLSGLALADAGPYRAFFLLTLAEETLEMSGVALCIASLLHFVEYRQSGDGTAYRLAERHQRSLPDDESRPAPGTARTRIRGGRFRRGFRRVRGEGRGSF